ncbi:hypothetical protein OF83DRAFT_797779 [Amylostereum chailletii]|nr:hypothetical protein OF83DRAFT_797779 [Amylostereum chailletii]
MADPAAPLPNIAKLALGPGLIGTILNVALYGISVTQTYYYLSKYKKDRLWMKLLVLFIFIADTVNSVFDIIFVYTSLVDHFNDPLAVQTADWVFATDPAMTSIIGSTVQFFFSWRVKVLTGSIPLTVILMLGSFVSGLGGIATSIAIGIVPHWLEFQKFQAPVIVWLVTSSLVDVTITIVLTWHLRSHKTGFTHTDDVLDKIIRLTVQTGMITAVWAIVDLGIFLGNPTGLHLIFNFPLSKLYSNSLLSSLNSRQGWKYQTTSEGVIQANQLKSSNARPAQGQVLSFGTSVRPEVFVDVESHELRDRNDSKTGFENESDPDYYEEQPKLRSPDV